MQHLTGAWCYPCDVRRAPIKSDGLENEIRRGSIGNKCPLAPTWAAEEGVRRAMAAARGGARVLVTPTERPRSDSSKEFGYHMATRILDLVQ